MDIGNLFTHNARIEAPSIGIDDDDALARAAWSALVEPGSKEAGELIAEHGAYKALQEMPGERIRHDWIDDRLLHVMVLGRQNGMTFITPSHPHWPSRLNDLGVHAPAGLWVRGDTSVLMHEAPVAIVGARAVTQHGAMVTRDITTDLARDHLIISGGALGVDGAAHQATLDARGKTVAILASGADRAYPPAHKELFVQIMQAGAVVSEVAPGTQPTRWRFLARNRIVAAIARATLVTEASEKSGTTNTMRHAVTLGRPLAVVPGVYGAPQSSGCAYALRELDATAVTSADDVRRLVSGR